MFGGIEAGGTKFTCAIGTGPDDLILSETIPTTTPAETFAAVIKFFREHPPVEAIGIGSFGPVDLNPESPTYGYITSTPKANWGQTRFVGTIQDALQVPATFDTDVNAAALGEYRWGAAQGLNSCIYLTVGTGIGGGGIVGGKLIHGLIHPEMGHLYIPRHPDDSFEGNCPFHTSCLEGLATGPSIEARWKMKGATIPADHPAWTLEAHYLALGLVNYIYTVSPERIILGGGVMHQAQLFPMIRQNVKHLLHGYPTDHVAFDHMETYIVPPLLKDNAGVLGAIALAQLGYSVQ